MIHVDISRINICPIAVMEDDIGTANFIRNTLTRLGCGETILLSDKNDACQVAMERKIKYFILDIHMGKGRNQEGLDVLEELKSIDSSIFVAILSGYNGNYKRMAIRLNVDSFQSKSDNRSKDIQTIVYEMLDSVDKKIHFFKRELVGSDNNDDQSDINCRKFNELVLNESWLAENQDKYFALCDGEVIASSFDLDSLFREIKAISKDKPKFISKASRVVDVIDLASPFDIID